MAGEMKIAVREIFSNEEQIEVITFAGKQF